MHIFLKIVIAQNIIQLLGYDKHSYGVVGREGEKYKKDYLTCYSKID